MSFLGKLWLIHNVLAAGLLLFSIQSQAAVDQNSEQYSITPVPAWVHPVGVLNSRPDIGVVGGERYLLVDRQYRDDGTTVSFHRHVVSEVTGQAGLSNASKINVRFDPLYERLELHSATVSRNGQRSDRLTSARIDVARTEESSESDLFYGELTALVVLSDIRVGDRIDVRYTIIGKNPVFDKRHHSSWRTRWGVPVDRSVLRISVPQGMILNHTERPAAQFDESVSGGLRTLQWVWNAHEATEAEQYTTRWATNPDRLEVTAFNSWNEVADWGTRLFSGHAKSGAGYQRLVQSLKKQVQAEGKDAAIVSAIDYVQQRIRYYGVELGVNSHRPHSPDEVIRNGFGDCKDKALLLISILSEIDVKAWPLLVSAGVRKGLTNRLPSPGVFDHAIVLVEHNGKQYWVDATDNAQSGLLGKRGQPQYGAALVLGKGENALITETRTPPEEPLRSTHDQFYLSVPGGPVEFVTSTVYRGEEANRMRRRIDEDGTRRLSKNYQEYYEDIYGDLEPIGKFNVEKDVSNNEIQVTVSYRLHKFWEVDRSDRTAHFDTYAITISNQLEDYEDIDKDRTLPLPVDGTTLVEHRIQFYPNIASGKRALEERQFSIDGFDYFDTEYVLGDSLVFESQLKVTADELDISQLDAYNRFKERVYRNAQSSRYFDDVDADEFALTNATVELLGELKALSQ